MRGLGETFFNGAVIAKYLPALLGGFRVTLALAAAVVTLGILLGLALAMARAFRIRALNWLIVAFVDVFWPPFSGSASFWVRSPRKRSGRPSRPFPADSGRRRAPRASASLRRSAAW